MCFQVFGVGENHSSAIMEPQEQSRFLYFRRGDVDVVICRGIREIAGAQEKIEEQGQFQTLPLLRSNRQSFVTEAYHGIKIN